MKPDIEQVLRDYDVMPMADWATAVREKHEVMRERDTIQQQLDAANQRNKEKPITEFATPLEWSLRQKVQLERKVDDLESAVAMKQSVIESLERAEAAERKLADATKTLISVEYFFYDIKAASQRQLIQDTLQALAQIGPPQSTYIPGSNLHALENTGRNIGEQPQSTPSEMED